MADNSNNTVLSGRVYTPHLTNGEQLEVLSYDSTTDQVFYQSSSPVRPTSFDATHIYNVNVVNNSSWQWTTEPGSGQPSGNGKMRIGDTTGAGKNANTVTAIDFDRNSTTGTDQSTTLNYLCEGGTIAFRNTSGTLVVDNWTIEEVDKSNAAYVRVWVSAGPSVTVTNATTYRVDFQSDARIDLPRKRYIRISIDNNSSATKNTVLVPSPDSQPGDLQTVEVVSVSGTATMNLYYSRLIQGSQNAYNVITSPVVYFNNLTPALTTLTYPGYAQVSIAQFMVNEVGSQPAFAYIGSDKIL